MGSYFHYFNSRLYWSLWLDCLSQSPLLSLPSSRSRLMWHWRPSCLQLAIVSPSDARCVTTSRTQGVGSSPSPVYNDSSFHCWHYCCRYFPQPCSTANWYTCLHSCYYQSCCYRSCLTSLALRSHVRPRQLHSGQFRLSRGTYSFLCSVHYYRAAIGLFEYSGLRHCLRWPLLNFYYYCASDG